MNWNFPMYFPLLHGVSLIRYFVLINEMSLSILIGQGGLSNGVPSLYGILSRESR